MRINTNTNIENVLDVFYKKLESVFRDIFYKYIVIVCQIKSSFHAFIGKKRGKILHENLKCLLRQVKNTSKIFMMNFLKNQKNFVISFFHYFKLVCCYGNYQYHFLVVKKDYI